MLDIVTRTSSVHRRKFLTIGSLGLGGLALPGLLAGRAAGADSGALATGKSVVFLFQQGGPSQFETFDPKPDAPESIRTIGGTIATTLPGVRFGEKMTRLARIADRLTIVRSFQTNNANHNIHPIVGPDSLGANIGGLFSRVVGATRPDSGMPTNSVIFPDAVCADVLKGRARGEITATGSLGRIHAPFVPGAGGQLQKNMRLTMPRDRLADREQLVADLNRLSQQVETAGEQKMIDHYHKLAYQLLLSGGVADALDLGKEDAATVARYDTRRYTRPDNWSKSKRGKEGMYTGHARALGKQMLLARRLCEAGCGYVTVHAGYDGVWDMHADVTNLNVQDGMEAVGPAFDHAVAAFLDDVRERGLEDRILLVCCGEMGRTPRINKNGGRDHWARLAPLLLAGGGLRGGQVLGQSTRDGGQPSTEPLTPRHLIATILHTLFDVGRLRVTPSLESVARLADYSPLPASF